MTKNRGEWFAKARAAKATSSEPPASDPVTPEEYGLRAAKRQLKKDNASLVEQNLALRSKVSVLADALAASQRKADEAIQAHTSLTETYKKVARERDNAEDALAASQEKIDKLSKLIVEQEREYHDGRKASQEKERQRETRIRSAVHHLDCIDLEDAITNQERLDAARDELARALDSTQTHGGSDGA